MTVITADWSAISQGSYSVPNPAVLEAPFTASEIKQAFFELEALKAPGPDGFSLLFFFHRFWNVIEPDVVAFFQSIYNGTGDLSEVNHAFITLIPKEQRRSRSSGR